MFTFSFGMSPSGAGDRIRFSLYAFSTLDLISAHPALPPSPLTLGGPGRGSEHLVYCGVSVPHGAGVMQWSCHFFLFSSPSCVPSQQYSVYRWRREGPSWDARSLLACDSADKLGFCNASGFPPPRSLPTFSVVLLVLESKTLLDVLTQRLDTKYCFSQSV